MRHLFLRAAAAASFMLAPVASAHAQPMLGNPAKLAAAHDILAIMFPPSQREAMIKRLQSDLMAQMMPEKLRAIDDPGIKKIIADFLNEALRRQRAVLAKHLPAQIDAMASAYTRCFSLDELQAIDAFAHTPAGSHYLAESPSIIGDPDVAKVNADLITDIRATTEAMEPDLKDKLIDYLQAHPDLAAKIATVEMKGARG